MFNLSIREKISIKLPAEPFLEKYVNVVHNRVFQVSFGLLRTINYHFVLCLHIDIYVPWLNQVLVCGSFVAYVAGAVFGMTKISPTINSRILVPNDDVYVHYLDAIEQNFLDYPPPVQVTFLHDTFLTAVKKTVHSLVSFLSTSS